MTQDRASGKRTGDGLAAVLGGLAAIAVLAPPPASAQNLAETPTNARAADGSYISWREHIIDDEASSGVELRGSDGLIMVDLDADGHLDIVSVHESDDQYDGVPEGHIRIAFGTDDPDRWHSITLAAGPEAGAAEDVAAADVDGDGDLDLVAACELAHLIYFENPGGERARSGDWSRLRPSVARERGSWIRVFLADLDGDGQPEVISPNKGAQNPERARQEPRPISFFELTGNPLEDASWREHVLIEFPWPINSRPVDLDGDGDFDIVGGSVAERRMVWFENRSDPGRFEFATHEIDLVKASADSPDVTVHGFNMDFVDLSGDGRLDIVTLDTPPLLGRRLLWLEQPHDPDAAWRYHFIDSYAPDSVVGIRLADIDDDGDTDIMTGGYSLSSRTSDEPTPGQGLGRLAWYEHTDSGWRRHDISRRQRGMFDKFVARDMDGDGDVDFVGTRGNSGIYDGVFWLEQVRTPEPRRSFERARETDSPEVPLP